MIKCQVMVLVHLLFRPPEPENMDVKTSVDDNLHDARPNGNTAKLKAVR